jgi:hypothetical protein
MLTVISLSALERSAAPSSSHKALTFRIALSFRRLALSVIVNEGSGEKVTRIFDRFLVFVSGGVGGIGMA